MTKTLLCVTLGKKGKGNDVKMIYYTSDIHENPRELIRFCERQRLTERDTLAIDRVRKDGTSTNGNAGEAKMEHNEKLLNGLGGIVEEINGLRDLAYVQYSKAVNEVLAGRITDGREIEHILDGIMDFGEDIRFSNLSKKPCRHIYNQYPQLVGDFMSMYRMLFVEEGDDGGTGNNHSQDSKRNL